MSKSRLLLIAMGFAGSAMGQVATSGPATTAPSTTGPSVQLGNVFESRVAGIQLQAPVGGTLIRQVNSGDIVRFIYPENGWDIHVKTTHSSKPVLLSKPRDANGTGGLVELTVDELKSQNPSAEVLEEDVKSYPPYQVGMIVARYNAGTDRLLTQQAIFRLDDQTYYIVQLTSAARAKTDDQEDPRETAANQAFAAMLNTVKLLDRSGLKQEQDQRLYRSHEFYSLLTEKQIRSALNPNQLLRVLRDGKDVGYIQVTEKLANHANHDGVEIVLGSHLETDAEPEQSAPASQGMPSGSPDAAVVPTVPSARMATPAPLAPTGPTRIDRLARLFVTFDRRHEDWAITTSVDDGRTGLQSGSELGNSDEEVHQVLDETALRNHKMGDPADPKQPPVRHRERYALSVSSYSKSKSSKPVERELPPYYLPQALAHLLPRLLPLDHADTYMFYSYVNDQREVMARYVDVLPIADVVLDGVKLRAVPIKDRIGVDGSPTIHYVTSDGHWVGSINEDSKLTVLPSDEQTIKQFWKDAKLAPAVAEQK